MTVTVTLEEGLCRDGDEHRAGRDPGRDSGRGVLSRLAGVARAAGASSSRRRFRTSGCPCLNFNPVRHRDTQVAAAIAVMRAGAARGILGRMTAHPDRLRDVVDAVIEALDEGLDGRALAARAMLSPFHFNRLVRAGIGEAPAAFRRRLLLERAAWRLGRGVSVTEAGLEAGYDAVEAFSRAFTRAHGVPPSRFADEPRDFRLAAPNGIHFHPPGGLLLPGQPRTHDHGSLRPPRRARPLAHRATAGAGRDALRRRPRSPRPARAGRP